MEGNNQHTHKMQQQMATSMDGAMMVSSQVLEESDASLRKREVFATSLRKEKKKALLFEKRKKFTAKSGNIPAGLEIS